mmetsp:Transcript_16241/g.49448  ORF Transcript_16241/g.49448 Transcript_16241/m.49448 type:complete len:222 (+) Transcript_16241:294-959(+)
MVCTCRGDDKIDLVNLTAEALSGDEACKLLVQKVSADTEGRRHATNGNGAVALEELCICKNPHLAPIIACMRMHVPIATQGIDNPHKSDHEPAVLAIVEAVYKVSEVGDVVDDLQDFWRLYHFGLELLAGQGEDGGSHGIEHERVVRNELGRRESSYGIEQQSSRLFEAANGDEEHSLVDLEPVPPFPVPPLLQEGLGRINCGCGEFLVVEKEAQPKLREQ